MKSTIHLSAIAAAALTVFLSACGGGGGSSSPAAGAATPASGASAPSAPGGGATPASGASSTPAIGVISLLAAPGAAVTDYAATGDLINDSLGFMNAKRGQLGLPPLGFQSAVAQAAANHSLYNQTNNAVGHFETAGLPGFTGVSPTDRVNALYPTDSIGEIVDTQTGAFTSSTGPIEALFDAPFHRGIILFDTTLVGVGAAQTTNPLKFSALTADFVDYKAFVPDNKLIAYPYPGQTNAKAAWQDFELPDPLAAAGKNYAGQTVGYPITLSGAGNAAFSNIAFEITDATGAAVPCQEVDSSNNDEATRLALCTPFAPLATSATYSVHVTGSLTNVTIPTPRAFDVSWSFTTAPATPAAAKTEVGGPARRVIIQ